VAAKENSVIVFRLNRAHVSFTEKKNIEENMLRIRELDKNLLITDLALLIPYWFGFQYVKKCKLNSKDLQKSVGRDLSSQTFF
jgi:hypothetical protein